MNKYLICRQIVLLLILLCGDVPLHPRPDSYSNECHKFDKLKGLKIMHLNARSIFNKINQLRLICHESKPDLLCPTERWLNSRHEDFEIRIDGYDLYRRVDRLKAGEFVFT
jgi:hypothetical protein